MGLKPRMRGEAAIWLIVEILWIPEPYNPKEGGNWGLWRTCTNSHSHRVAGLLSNQQGDQQKTTRKNGLQVYTPWSPTPESSAPCCSEPCYSLLYAGRAASLCMENLCLTALHSAHSQKSCFLAAMELEHQLLQWGRESCNRHHKNSVWWKVPASMQLSAERC
jgi:hypothetical protein